MADKKMVKVKVNHGHTLVVARNPENGWPLPGRRPGSIVEVEEAEAKRLLARGVVVNVDDPLPPRPEGPSAQPQGPDFTKRA